MAIDSSYPPPPPESPNPSAYDLTALSRNNLSGQLGRQMWLNQPLTPPYGPHNEEELREEEEIRRANGGLPDAPGEAIAVSRTPFRLR